MKSICTGAVVAALALIAFDVMPATANSSIAVSVTVIDPCLVDHRRPGCEEAAHDIASGKKTAEMVRDGSGHMVFTGRIVAIQSTVTEKQEAVLEIRRDTNGKPVPTGRIVDAVVRTIEY